jgi:uncharacterized membrane protein YccC
MRYFFPFDPTGAWFIHSLKSLLACLIAAGIAIYEYNSASLWIFFPTTVFVLTADINRSLLERMKFLLLLAATSVIVVVIMAFLFPWLYIKTAVFLFIAAVFCYIANKNESAATFSYAVIAFACIGYVFPSHKAHFEEEVLNFVLSISIALGVTFFIFPQRLDAQLKKQFHVTTQLLGRYVIFVLADSMRGNTDLKNRDESLQRLLDLHKRSQDIYEKINTEKVDEKKKKNIEKMLEILRKNIYLATSIENAIFMLPEQALFRGPFAELYRLFRTLQKAFENIRTHQYDQFDQQTFEHDIKKIEVKFDDQLSISKETSVYVYWDYRQWRQMLFVLKQFASSLKTLNDALKEFGC